MKCAILSASMQASKPSKRHAVLALLVAVVVGFIFVVSSNNALTSNPTTTSKESNSSVTGFNKKRLSVDEPGSLWWIVNKKRSLPSGYVPPNLKVPGVRLRLSNASEQMKIGSETSVAVEELFSAAKAAGFSLVFASGYRSESYQKQLYDSYVQQDGQEAADRYSARPGTSEHQTGMAFDVCVDGSGCELEESFGNTPEGEWIAKHAHEFGLIVRYLPGKESITGYQYEPWHLRYVGKELASELHQKGLTMEEFLL